MIDETMQAVIEGVTKSVKKYISDAIGRVNARIDAIPAARDGKDGVDGKDAVVDYQSIIDEIVKEIPAPRDGRDGKDGEKGERGEKGESGISIQGERGARGERGEKGEDGKTGDKGDRGDKGDPGESIKGERGEKGEDGESIRGDRGEPGERGIKGERGMDGRDAIQLDILPAVDFSKSYPRCTYARHQGGIIRSYRDTLPNAEFDHSGWEVVIAGIDGISIGMGEDNRTLTIFSKRTGSEPQAVSFVLPVLIYRGVYDPNSKYQHGDVVTWNGSAWHCQTSEPQTKPAENSDWRLMVKEGRKGKDADENKNPASPTLSFPAWKKKA
jgi:hypothetical protein